MRLESPLRSRTWSSIRTQIILGFGLILGLTLVIVVINFFALQIVRSGIEATVDEAGRVRELSQAIQNEFLLARQQEQLFLDNWRGLGYEEAFKRHVIQNDRFVNRARTNLAALEALLGSTTAARYRYVSDEAAALTPAMASYQEAFGATVNRIQERSRAGGQEARLQESLIELEDSAGQLRNSNELNRVVVQMSANEQAFFNTGEQQYIDQTRLLALRAKDLLNNTAQLSWAYSDLARPNTLEDIDQHMVAFQELVVLENDIGINTAIADEVTDAVAQRTETIRQEGIEGLEQARQDLQQATVGSIVVAAVFGLIALAAGIITALLLARRIIGPLTELTRAAQSIGEGNLEYRVSITGQDEFATLATVFNQMAGQLHNLIGSLERLVAERTRALTTSFRVSRRLSRILDQNQLVSEVVEQVRSAFDYYHVHIYLFNEDKSQLIMVGGTGNAGRAMLAAGHRIERGRGLVGRAAESRRAVIVSDVTRDPGWLANPLLPNTRSEIATPIILGDEVLGVLDVQQDVRGGLTRADAELLQSIANQVAIALRNAELYQYAQQAAEREAVVNVINQRIQQAASLDGVLQTAAEEIGRALGSRETTIQLDAGMAATETIPEARRAGAAVQTSRSATNGRSKNDKANSGQTTGGQGSPSRRRSTGDGAG
ncbi:MAG: GAF domain-containing protein [Chloroflexota bacterium]|jgi:GAF domain-containing protein/HAMP domain-containing protein